MLLLLLACATSDDTDTAGTSLTGCLQGPKIEITSPESSVELPVNQPVSLAMDVESEVDDISALRLLWNVYFSEADDDQNVGTNPSETWTPTVTGIWLIRAQVEDTCTDELGMKPVQDSVTVEVIPACFAGPTVEITTPESAAELPVNQPITLTMSAASEVDIVSAIRVSWSVQLEGAADPELLGTDATITWTPTVAGIWTIRAAVEDTCTDELALEPVQDAVTIEVIQ